MIAYIILDSKAHIVWDLYYFETTSIFFDIISRNIKTLSLVAHNFYFLGVLAMGMEPTFTLDVQSHLNTCPRERGHSQSCPLLDKHESVELR